MTDRSYKTNMSNSVILYTNKEKTKSFFYIEENINTIEAQGLFVRKFPLNSVALPNYRYSSLLTLKRLYNLIMGCSIAHTVTLTCITIITNTCS